MTLKTKSGGFTLVEMMIVVAIIAIIAVAAVKTSRQDAQLNSERGTAQVLNTALQRAILDGDQTAITLSSQEDQDGLIQYLSDQDYFR